ncbi:synaptic vesicle 2-related protein-like isoform X2 [Corticium candelabrum]|nr:synaptic vesicle 2-related protein-like isoform X2 [Corticium candelabrum]
MEIMVLSILAVEARCEYGLESWQESLITTVVFFGMFWGSWLWGKFMDKFGRWKGLLLVCVSVSVSSLVSAFAPNYVTLLLFRCVVGFGISGSMQAATYYAEFLPAKRRAICLVLMEIFWAVGTISEVLLALFVLGHLKLDWHWLLGFTSVPVFIDLLAFMFVPESPFYYISSGHPEKAHKVLEQVARDNGSKLPSGQLVSKREKQWIEFLKKDIEETQNQVNGPLSNGYCSDSNVDLQSSDADTVQLIPMQLESSKGTRGRFYDLFSTTERSHLTLLLWVIWLGAAFGYYGIVLLSTELLDVLKEQQERSNSSNNVLQCIGSAPVSSKGNCTHLETDDYMQLLWTTVAEIPGMLLTLLIIERIGRKKTMAVEFFLAVPFFLLMYICPVHKFALLAFIFGARGVLTGAFQAVMVYTPEAYPTSIRGLGFGFCSSVARIGAMITPFVAEVLLRKSVRGAEGLYAGVALVCGICCLLLPYETKGKALQESLDM